MDIAKYICEDEERLQMALRVYEAKDDVRDYLIERVFKAVGEKVAEKLDGMEVSPYTTGLEFHQEDCNFWVYAEVSSRRHQQRGSLWLHAGLYDYADPVDKAKQDEMRERFKTKSDLETWSSGKNFDGGNTVAYAYIQHEGYDDRWDTVGFLSRAIRNHDEVVSDVADILVRIYEGVFVR